MNLNPIQSGGRAQAPVAAPARQPVAAPARQPVAAPARQPGAGLDVTISDGGVAVQGTGTQGRAGTARPAVEARFMTAIATPRQTAAAAPAAPPRISSVAAAAAESPSASAPASRGPLGMYTGRGRAATMPREGLAGQLIDVTG